MSCKLSDKCDNVFACNILRPNVELLGCNFYKPKKPKKPMTNEEYLRSCNAEQLADVLLEHFEWGLSINAEFCFTEKYVELNRKHILEWLKQPHNS